MRDLLSHIIEGILGTEIEVKEENSDGMVNFVVNVPKEQVGIIIGKSGRTINAIKNILKIKAIKEGVRVDIQVNEA